MTSANFSDFLTPSPGPLVTVTNQLILFLLSAFWGTPPHPLRTSYVEAPNNLRVASQSRLESAILSLLLGD